jgi:hypothetical protein
MQDEWRIQVPRSEWLAKLRSAGARDVLLLEIPLPLLDTSKRWEEGSGNIYRVAWPKS